MSLESIGFPPRDDPDPDPGLFPELPLGRHAAKPSVQSAVLEALTFAMARGSEEFSPFTAALEEFADGHCVVADTADIRALLGVARAVKAQLSAVEALAYQRLSEAIGERP